MTSQEPAECQAFRAALRVDAGEIRVDQGEYIAHVAELLDQRKTDVIAGFTRDSDFLVLQHLAAERGFGPTYWGRHVSRDSTISHTLIADTTVLRTLRRRLAASADDWVDVLAASLPVLAVSGSERKEVSIKVPLARPASGTHYLVSWAFRLHS